MNERKYKPASSGQLEHEAHQWELGELHPKDWVDAPDAVPRGSASTLISMRVPNQMLIILKALAQKEGVGYQVLIKRWLDARIKEEQKQLVSLQAIRLYQPRMVNIAATFSPGEGQVLHESEVNK